MKTQNLLSLSTFIIATLTITSISHQAVTASEPIFFCESESNQDIPTTIAKNQTGQTKPIFYWNLNEVNTSAQPQQLCNSVTQKLNDYHQAGNDLSSLNFKAATVLDDESLTTLPAICVAEAENSCKVALFTLSPSENPQITASQALDSILAQELQISPLGSQTRGLQSTSYEVDFWQLFGGK